MNIIEKIALGLLVLFWILFLYAWFEANRAEAQPAYTSEPWPIWNEDSRLNHGRCLVAESDFTAPQDWPGISHVLIKVWRVRSRRRGWTFNETIIRYCNVFRARSPRARRIRNSIWSKPLHRSPREWKALAEWIEKFETGTIADPTPEADGWNCEGCYDPDEWIIIAGPPLTANYFLKSIK